MSSDISDTIHQGTGEIQRGYAALTAATQAHTERKQAALEASERAFSQAGEAYKKNVDWRDAKQEEDQIAQVGQAELLARASHGPQGVPIALGSLHLTHKGAVKFATDRSDQAAKELGDQNLSKLRDAEITHYDNEDKRIKAELKAKDDQTRETKDFFDKNPPAIDEDPRLSEARAGVAAGAYTVKQYQNIQTMISNEKKAAAAVKSREEQAGKNRDLRRDVARWSNTTKENIAGNTLNETTLHHLAEEGLARSRLAFDKTNAENSQLTKNRIQSWKEAVDEAKISLAGNVEHRRAVQSTLKSELQRNKQDRYTVMVKGWNGDEDKKDLLNDLDNEGATIESLLGELDVMDKLDPVQIQQPKEKLPVVGKPTKSDSVPSPEEMETSDILKELMK